MVRNKKWWWWKGNGQAPALREKEEQRRGNREPMHGCKPLPSISFNSHFSLESTFMSPVLFSVSYPAPWSPKLPLSQAHWVGESKRGDSTLLTGVSGEMCSWHPT